MEEALIAQKSFNGPTEMLLEQLIFSAKITGFSHFPLVDKIYMEQCRIALKTQKEAQTLAMIYG